MNSPQQTARELAEKCARIIADGEYIGDSHEAAIAATADMLLRELNLEQLIAENQSLKKDVECWLYNAKQLQAQNNQWEKERQQLIAQRKDK